MMPWHLGDGRDLRRVQAAHAAREHVKRHPAVTRDLTRMARPPQRIQPDQGAGGRLLACALVDVVARVDAAQDVLTLVLEDAPSLNLREVVHSPHRAVAPPRHPECAPRQ